jgi:hypothetical protein
MIGVYYVIKWKEAIPTKCLHRVVKQENVNVLAEILAFGSFQGTPDLPHSILPTHLQEPPLWHQLC